MDKILVCEKDILPYRVIETLNKTFFLFLYSELIQKLQYKDNYVFMSLYMLQHTEGEDI